MKWDVTGWPYVRTDGKIEVPDEITDDDEVIEYIYDHFDDIKWEPVDERDFDYMGTELEFFPEEALQKRGIDVKDLYRY